MMNLINNSREPQSLEECNSLLAKMDIYSLQKGYISRTNSGIDLYILPCHKAEATITKSEILKIKSKL